MSQIAQIAIQDGKTTPVTHTFNPISSSPSAYYRESVASLALVGQGTLDLRMREESSVIRVNCVMSLPALESASGANSAGYTAGPKVAYSHTVKVEFLLPKRGDAAQRKDLRVMLQNLLANTQVIDLVENLAVPY